MLRKIATIFVVILLLPVFLTAQEHTILKPDGTTYTKYGDLTKAEVIKVTNGKTVTQERQNINSGFSNTPMSPDGTIDTLSYDPPWDTNFGYFGQDWMLQWFVCPADLTLKFAGFATNENDDAMPVELKIVKVLWAAEDLASAGTVHHGWYEADGNGFNNITAFIDNPDNTGPWVNDDGLTEPFGNDVWSDGGVGFTIVPVGGARTDYQWVDMSLLGEPTFLQGEIFGIVMKHAGPDMDLNRIGYWASGINPQWGWKFYANGRTTGDLSTAGWWSREFHWNFRAVVELTGDRAPEFNSFTIIPSGPELGPFTVDANITDDNPGDPPNAGVASANINWTNDGGTNWNVVPMTGSEPNFTGEIPVQVPNTTVEYFLDATDVMGLNSETIHVSYFVFGPSGASTLVIYNGLGSVSGYPQNYYWGSDIQSGTTTFDHDRWAYGEVPLSVANNYTDIIEFGNSGPSNYNDDAIRDWLAAGGSHNYYLTGQEWLGAKTGFSDSTYVPGDFEYDILGVLHSYNDVSYDGVSGQELPSLVMPLAGTMFGGPLLDLFNSYDPPADSMMYNPVFEVGMSDWIDAFDVVAGVGVEVDMNVETRGIESQPNVQILPTMAHRELPAGNKIMFVAYDPLSLNTAFDGSFPYYNWTGYDVANSPYQAAFNWFGIPTGVIDVGGVVPNEYTISQNYPNPFNPSTTIKFSVPVQSNVVLKVYNILGSEVATLFNGVKSAGNYEVNFDASNLASGMYIYTISAGNFTTSKKMMLLK